ncbi:MAG: methyl-accepting chemotaxis protein, partial [Lachnospiraceae bacterium]|nr:methyl-accepting chemotaxis protein [Lachnospiraceae bacterium]
MKSIKQKLIVSVGVLVIVICVALCAGSYYSASSVLEATTETNLKEIAKQSSGTVSSLVSGNLKEINAIAARADLADEKVSPEEKVAILSQEVERIGCLRMAYIDTKGDSHSTNGKS